MLNQLVVRRYEFSDVSCSSLIECSWYILISSVFIFGISDTVHCYGQFVLLRIPNP